MIDAFLRLDGIKGESKDAKHKDTIDVQGFSWALNQVGVQNMGGGGGGAGKVSVGDIVVNKKVDRASPALLLYCVTGKHIANGSLIFRKAGEKPLEYLTIKMEDLLVTNVSDAGHGGANHSIPDQQVSLNFSRFHIIYRPQQASGGGAPQSEMGFDIKANKKI